MISGFFTIEGTGRPLPGFSLEQCPDIVGDEIERTAQWNGGGNLVALASRLVRLRFAMKDADLYSFRFRY
jgi:hypothetical protein